MSRITKRNWSMELGILKDITDAFNAGNWNSVISGVNTNKYYYGVDSINQTTAYLMYGIAKANRDNDYTTAYLMYGIAKANRDNDYTTAIKEVWKSREVKHDHEVSLPHITYTNRENHDLLIPRAEAAAKKSMGTGKRSGNDR